MLKDKKVIVVMPAYNAARTLRKTYDEVMSQGIVDLVVLVDDGSHDETVAIGTGRWQLRQLIVQKTLSYWDGTLATSSTYCSKLLGRDAGNFVNLLFKRHCIRLGRDAGNFVNLGTTGTGRWQLRTCGTGRWQLRQLIVQKTLHAFRIPFPL